MVNLSRTIILFLIAMVSFSACAAVLVGGAAAGATYTYISGWMEKDYPVSLKKAYKASINAVNKHDLKITEKGRDITFAFVKAKGAKREVHIKLKRKSARLTKISIRVGLLGDKDASKIIHQSIGDFL